MDLFFGNQTGNLYEESHLGILEKNDSCEKFFHAMEMAMDDIDDVKELLENGANPNCIFDYRSIKYTPLLFALHIDNLKTAMYLIEHGADVNLMPRGNNNHSPPLVQMVSLQTTIEYYNYRPDKKENIKKLIRMLLEHGAEVNIQDEFGRTPLMDSMKIKDSETTKMLLEHGADINIQDRNRETAFIHAKTQPKKDLIIEQETKKWEKMFEKNEFIEIEKLKYKDKEIKNEHDKFLNKFVVSGMMQMLRDNKFVRLDNNNEFDVTQSLLAELNSKNAGGKKKRRKTVRKNKKRRKTRRM